MDVNPVAVSAELALGCTSIFGSIVNRSQSTIGPYDMLASTSSPGCCHESAVNDELRGSLPHNVGFVKYGVGFASEGCPKLPVLRWRRCAGDREPGPREHPHRQRTTDDLAERVVDIRERDCGAIATRLQRDLTLHEEFPADRERERRELPRLGLKILHRLDFPPQATEEQRIDGRDADLGSDRAFRERELRSFTHRGIREIRRKTRRQTIGDILGITRKSTIGRRRVERERVRDVGVSAGPNEESAVVVAPGADPSPPGGPRPRSTWTATPRARRHRRP